jgi:hypothetical protein
LKSRAAAGQEGHEKRNLNAGIAEIAVRHGSRRPVAGVRIEPRRNSKTLLKLSEGFKYGVARSWPRAARRPVADRRMRFGLCDRGDLCVANLRALRASAVRGLFVLLRGCTR